MKRWPIEPPRVVTVTQPVEVPPVPKKIPEFLGFKCINCFEMADCLYAGRSYCKSCLHTDRSLGKV